VNDRVLVLNPPKDNLICDAAKVEEILGVPPQRVVDVMALRGDSIDNIPGAPGIGDKGSVELIQRFGSLEGALEHAAEVERKTYRESLLNHRDQILMSKELATIKCDVNIELDIEKMHAGEPDVEALRALFGELEFTSLLKDLLPAVEAAATDYREAKSSEDVNSVLKALAPGTALAVAIESALQTTAVEPEDEEEPGRLLPLSVEKEDGPRPRAIAISSQAGSAVNVSPESAAVSALNSVLADGNIPKAIHDWKAAIHTLEEGRLAGVRHDTRLYSYLLDPTYSSHSLPEVALRRFNLKLSGSLAEAADLTGRLAIALRKDVEEADLLKLYDEIDLPLVQVLARMERAGVAIDREALGHMSARLEREIDAKAN